MRGGWREGVSAPSAVSVLLEQTRERGEGVGVVLNGRGMLGRESAKRPQLRVKNTGSVRQILESLDRDFVDDIVVYYLENISC